jgi:hypothetical protein
MALALRSGSPSWVLGNHLRIPTKPGIERISTYGAFEALEVPVRRRANLTVRLSHVMGGLGWTNRRRITDLARSRIWLPFAREFLRLGDLRWGHALRD